MEKKTIRISWDIYYNELEKYYQEHGNIDICQSYEINGLKLGRWLNNQRQVYKGNATGKLSQEKIDKLNKLGMNWEKRLTWDDHYRLLEEYYNKYGNINVPQSYEINGIKLGKWLSTQRRAYKGNVSNKITEKHIEKLNKLGMEWKINLTWDEYYELVKEYYNETGNIDIPQKYIKRGVNLGNWISIQRKAYKGLNKRKITEEQISKLNELGMKWDAYVDNWNERYKILEEYYQQHRNIDIPKNYEVDGIQINNWLNTQNASYRGTSKNTITNEHIVLLNKLENDWCMKDTIALNKNIKDMNKYNITMLKRVKNILRDLTLEGINEIDTNKTQKEIEKIIVKRMWR